MSSGMRTEGVSSTVATADRAEGATDEAPIELRLVAWFDPYGVRGSGSRFIKSTL